MEMVKEKIIAFLIISIILLSAIGIIYLVVRIVINDRHELELCANKINMNFTWDMGASYLPFSIDYSNSTHIFCCYKEKSLSSDGALINKCFLANKEIK